MTGAVDPDPVLVERWLQAGRDARDRFVDELVASGKSLAAPWTLTLDEARNLWAALRAERLEFRLDMETLKATRPELFRPDEDEG